MQPERHKRILQEINEKGHVSVQSLAGAFAISHMTVRRDLDTLERKGYLFRTHGGAVKSEATNNLFSFNSRLARKSREKEYICRLAADFIESGDSISVDCGTTPYRLGTYIRNKRNLRIVSNSLPLVSELVNYPNIRINLIGGELNRERKATYGQAAEQNFRAYRTDKAFIGADGVSLQSGLSSYDEAEARVTCLMAHNAATVFLLCDSSKLESDSYLRFADISLFHYLITDKECPDDILATYREAGIRVINRREDVTGTIADNREKEAEKV